ncbi:MAG: hypothetical protein QJR03_09140 [Sphaerobacter sp.]|nr:hypothetical protein [Sphaerobacter sp.]
MLATILQVIVELDPTKVENWETWAVGVGLAVVRAGARAALAALPLSTAEGTSEQ